MPFPEPTPPPADRRDTPQRRGVFTLDEEPFDADASLADQLGAGDASVRVRVLRPLLQAADERLPRSRVDRALHAARLDRAEVLAGARWVDAADLVALLDVLRDGCQDEREWERLCRSRLRESLGPVATLAPIRHPDTLFRLVGRVLPGLARGVRIEVRAASAVAVRVDVWIDGPDSPAFRTWRAALASELSRAFGMPAGRVVTLSHAGEPGQDHDELLVRYPLGARVTRLVLGLVGGVGAAAALGFAGLVEPTGMVAVATLGALLPVALDGVLGPRATERLVEEIAEALVQLDDEATGAVAELRALHARERAWSQRESEAVAARNEHQQARLAELERLLSQRAAAVRGLSHDLRNPLVTMALLPAFLRSELERLGGGSPAAQAMLDDQDEAVQRMRTMLGGFREAGTGDPVVRLQPVWVQLRTLCADVDGRLGALTFGRELTGRAVLAPTAPERVHIDRTVLDRIVDNLLTNACKYTDAGSIRVELDGDDRGGLVLLVRDTGRGIAPADQREVFRPGGSAPDSRAADSLGIGLSSVLRLVDQLGGTVSLRSAPGEGSRFTVRLPRDPPAEAEARQRLADTPAARLDRVLRILPF